MRFELMVAGVAAVGIALGVAVPFVPLPDVQAMPDFQAMNEKAHSGGDSSSMHFTLADLNPLRLIFDYEQHQMSANSDHSLFANAQPVTTPDFSWINRQQAQFNRDFDPAAMARLNGQSLQNEMNQRMIHQQDVMNYMQHPGVGPAPILP